MNDQQLLHHFLKTRDASAFELLTERHSAFVRSICYQILRNVHDAEEVTQECFVELVQHGDEIHTSVAGWLGRAATSRSLNFLRSRLRRTSRERRSCLDAETEFPAADLSAQELRSVVARAMVELPEDLRKPMELHYFQGWTQRDVARELGVNQSTVSRRMQDALIQLREKLTRAGFVTTAPAVVMISPDRLGATEAGISNGTLFGKPASYLAGIVGQKGWLLPVFTLAIGLLIDGWITFAVALLILAALIFRRPAWVNDLYSSQGVSSIDQSPFFPFSTWSWQVVPTGWKRECLTAVVWSVGFAVLTTSFASLNPIPWGSVSLGGTISLACLLHSTRILCRRWRIARANTQSRIPADQTIPSSMIVIRHTVQHQTNFVQEQVQPLVIGLIGVSVAARAIFDGTISAFHPAVLLTGLISGNLLLRLIGSVMLRSRKLCVVGRPGEVINCDVAPDSSMRMESTGTRRLLLIGLMTIVGCSAWIWLNPNRVGQAALSLAATQTLVLGWMFARLAHFTSRTYGRRFSQVVLVILTGCFVLNSGLCLASMFR